MRQAVHRYLYTVVNYSAAMNGISDANEIVPVTPWWQMAINAVRCATIALAAIAAVLMVVSMAKKAGEEKAAKKQAGANGGNA